MEDFEEYLGDGADAADQEAIRRLQRGFSELRRKSAVEGAARERSRMRRAKRVRLIVVAGIILLSMGLAYLFVLREDNTLPQDQEIKFEQPDPIGNDSTKIPSGSTPEESLEYDTVAPNEQTPGTGFFTPPLPPDVTPSTPVPIASAEPETTELPPPPYAAPTRSLRGANAEETAALGDILDQLWYVTYPLEGMEPGDRFAELDSLLQNRVFTRAFINVRRLERELPANDTLRLLKGYTFLEMGQGKEALESFDAVEVIPPRARWQLEWYKGLAQLLAGEEAAARQRFQLILSEGPRPYADSAQKALDLLP